jgi:hypothetical protein
LIKSNDQNIKNNNKLNNNKLNNNISNNNKINYKQINKQINMKKELNHSEANKHYYEIQLESLTMYNHINFWMREHYPVAYNNKLCINLLEEIISYIDERLAIQAEVLGVEEITKTNLDNKNENVINKKVDVKYLDYIKNQTLSDHIRCWFEVNYSELDNIDLIDNNCDYISDEGVKFYLDLSKGSLKDLYLYDLLNDIINYIRLKLGVVAVELGVAFIEKKHFKIKKAEIPDFKYDFNDYYSSFKDDNDFYIHTCNTKKVKNYNQI